MKQMEIYRNKRIETYVFISQVLFVILMGILLARAYYGSNLPVVSVYRNLFFIVVPIAALLILKKAWKRGYTNQGRKLDYAINAVYLVITVTFLFQETDSFFRFLLLMPVVVASIQYGARSGYLWAFLVSLGLVIIDLVQRPANLDVNILTIGMIWLLAWLLGKMSETERETRQTLIEHASMDTLTGLHNHRSFYHFLDEYYIKAKLSNNNLTLIMIDVDYFKYYNDAYGHQKGDEVLAELARHIEQEAPGDAICCRYGGDEFVVILPGYSSKGGMEVGEKIRLKVEGAVFDGSHILPGGRFTISVGVAAFPESANSKEELLNRADEALYKAKYSNSNKVELYYSVFDEIGHTLQDKEKDLLNSMRTLMMVVNAKDRYTYGHCERVMHYSEAICKKLSLWEWEINNINIGALLHDIGKIEITRETLNKQGSLTPEEWDAVKNHSIWGADIIRPISAFSGAVDIVLYHHENYDGSGYPYGLAGEEIPLGARILRIADSFDAMISNRPYKRSLSVWEALQELKKYKGIYYDPEVLDAFIDYVQKTGVVAGYI